MLIMHNVDGSHIDPSQIVNIADAEGQFLVSYTNKPGCEAPAFLKEFSAGKFYFNFKKEILKYSKRNSVTVAKQIDDTCRQLLGNVILSGMHPACQILNHDEKRKFQNRGTEHLHTSIHVVDAPRFDENDETKDDELASFIDKYMSCSIPNKKAHPKLSSLVNEAQTHHATSCRKKVVT